MVTRERGPEQGRERGLGRDDAEFPAEPNRSSWLPRDAPRHRLPGSTDEDQEIWLLSYSDLVTLLFSVFVMLLAITTLKDQLPKAPAPVPPALALPLPENSPEPEPEVPPVPQPQPAPAAEGSRLRPDEVAVTAPATLAERWRARLAALGLPPGVTVTVKHNRVAIVIGDTILFASGQAELSAEGGGVLARLAPSLRATSGEIVVEGHTDPTPIASSRFPSNWELSAARAAGVARVLIDLGVPPPRLSAVGYADTRPLAEGRDAAALARNRRVTLSIQLDEE